MPSIHQSVGPHRRERRERCSTRWEGGEEDARRALVNPIILVSIIALSGGKSRKFLGISIRLDTGAPSGYLDPYLQVFSDKNPYLDLQGSFPTVHLDPQVFYLQVTGQQVLKVPAGIQ
jgi:hypothetical protein